MLGRLRLPRKPDEQELGYGTFYLKEDVGQSRIAMLLFAIPLAGFSFNDYMFFGFSTFFFELASVRLVLLLVTAIEFLSVGKVKSRLPYNKLVFSAILAILVGGGIINATRPENFLVHSIMTIVSVFVLYLVVPLRFLFQGILATITTVGEVLIILAISSASGTIVFTLLFSMFVSNIIAAMSSWQLHLYRRRIFDEFTKRKEAQDALEQHANHLSELVTEQTKELAEAQSNLLKNERLAAIGELAGMVGHDLRNPLTAIKNAAYFLKKKNSDSMNDSSNEMLAIIDRSVNHANNIVGDLLDYSREMTLELEEYSPKSLVDYVLMSIKPSSQIKILDRTESFPTIWVDANKIERVFVNLIKNAIDAMPEGGTLEIASRQNGENVEFIFADTGTGMSGEVVAKIFTPLFTTKAQGMGFGLAICKRIVEAHHGKISVESVLNKGTTFTITLPVEQK